MTEDEADHLFYLKHKREPTYRLEDVVRDLGSAKNTPKSNPNADSELASILRLEDEDLKLAKLEELLGPFETFEEYLRKRGYELVPSHSKARRK